MNFNHHLIRRRRRGTDHRGLHDRVGKQFFCDPHELRISERAFQQIDRRAGDGRRNQRIRESGGIPAKGVRSGIAGFWPAVNLDAMNGGGHE